MAKSFVMNQAVKGSWKATDANGFQSTKNFGDSDEPSGAVNFATGITAGKCDVFYRRAASIAGSGGTFSLDLKGGNGELDAVKDALSMVKVRLIRLIIVTPTTAVTLKIGPQNVSNGFLGPFPVLTANGYVTVSSKFEMDDPVDGWAVGASTKVLEIVNPSTPAVEYVLEIAGTSA